MAQAKTQTSRTSAPLEAAPGGTLTAPYLDHLSVAELSGLYDSMEQIAVAAGYCLDWPRNDRSPTIKALIERFAHGAAEIQHAVCDALRDRRVNGDWERNERARILIGRMVRDGEDMSEIVALAAQLAAEPLS